MVSGSVKKSWQINTEINLRLLEHLTEAMLGAPTPGGGLTVAQHIVHVLNAVKFWGCYFDEARFVPLPDLFDTEGDVMIPVKDLKKMYTLMMHSREVALEAAEAATDKGKLPYDSIETFLIHIIAHDAHHRGQVVLALKTNSYLLPDNDLMWGPWRGE